MKMKREWCLLAAVCSGPALATVYTGYGEVNDLLVRQSANSHALAYLSGLDSAGTCYQNAGKRLVVLSIPSDAKADAMYSLLLAAYMSGKKVSVGVDDAKVDNDGYCIIQDLRFNPGG